MRWLNYQHLYYFWQVAKIGSVTLASKQLKLAQPTISAQLKTFESVIGEKLFEREGRRLKTTEAGNIVLKYAEQIFSLGQELLQVLDGKISLAQSKLNIGISDVVPKAVAYRIIAPALADDSTVTVSCVEDKTDRLLADLSIGEIDIVIADRPISPSAKVKAYNHFVGECGISLLAAPEMAKRYRKGFPASLNAAPFLLPTPESAVRLELDQWFDTKGIEPKRIAVFQDRALMKIAARQSRGIIPIPKSIEKEVLAEFHLEVVGRIEEVKEQVYVISIERKLKNPLVLKFCQAGQSSLFKANS